MITSFRWDVAVVGAGPAGSAAAYHLASRNHRVVLLERSSFPRDKACGDGLTRTSVELLGDLGVLDALSSGLTITGARLMNSGRGHHDAPYRRRGPNRPSHGLVVPRMRLDDVLRRNAMSAGAELWEQCRASDVLLDDGRVVGVRVEHGGHQLNVNARFVVFADGAGSIARRLDLGVAGRVSGGFAMRGYYKGLNRLDPVFQMHLPLTDTLSGGIVPGYGWVFPLSETEANIGVGFFVSQQKDLDINLRRLFDRFLDELQANDVRFKAMLRVGDLKGARLSCGLDPARCWSRQALVVGDAAGLVDPYTGEGIDTALESSRLAADVLTSALEGRGSAEAPLNEYGRLLDERFRDRFQTGRKAIKSYFFTWKLLNSTLEVRRPLFNALRDTALDFGTENVGFSCLTCADDWSWLTSWDVPHFVYTVEGELASIIGAEYAILAQAASSLVDRRSRLARILVALITARFGQRDIAMARKVAVAIELGYLAQQVQLDIDDDTLPRRAANSGNEPNWGNRFAVMVGAYLLAESSRLFAALDSGSLALASKTTSDVCAAWMRERSYGPGQCPEAMYLQLLPAKAGGFIALASRLCGRLSQLPEMWISALELAARHLGVALQLRYEVDELSRVDVEGRDHPIARLLETGSFTLPMIRAQLLTELPRWVSLDSLEEDWVHPILERVRGSGAISATSQSQREFAARAAGSLSILPDQAETRALRDLAQWLHEGRLGLETGASEEATWRVIGR